MKTKKQPLTKLLVLQLTLLLSIIFSASGQEVRTLLANKGKVDPGTIVRYGASSTLQLATPYPGVNPLSGMVEANNKFYGVTSFGGEHDEGVLYEWDPVTRVYTKLHDFNRATGRYPWGEVTVLGDKLYGTTDQGGKFNFGVIYEWNLSTMEYKTWFDMDWLSGVSATGKFTYYNGKFYGVATDGGANGFGAIFEWDPVTNVYMKKIDMTSETGRIDGASLTLYNGKFYGGTIIGGGAYGAGILFEWDPHTNVFVKRIDSEPINGIYFGSTLTLHNDKLYGISFLGGVNGVGVLFEWDPITNVYTKKIDCNFNDGYRALRSPLTFINDKAYGLTFSGGTNDAGVLYEWDPAVNVFTPKVSFDNANGRLPVGALAYKNGELHGVTFFGGIVDAGVLFSWNIATNKFTKHADFNAIPPQNMATFTLVNADTDQDLQTLTEGATITKPTGTNLNIRYNPVGSPASVVFKHQNKIVRTENAPPFSLRGDYSGNYLPWEAGTEGKHVVEATPYSEPRGRGTAGPSLTINFTIVEESPTNAAQYPGANPLSGMIEANSKFYGVTTMGGVYNEGVLYEWDPVTRVYTKLHDFENDQENPWGEVAFLDNKLYGTANIIYEWNLATMAYQKKLDLYWFEGVAASGKFTHYNGKFYGVATDGGANGFGAIFEWDPVTNVYTKKVDMTSETGRIDGASLALYNGKFYGGTINGGAYDAGVLFEWDPQTNVFTKKIESEPINGSYFGSTLTLYNGKFYGISFLGGINDVGVLFEWDPITNVYIKKIDCNFNDGYRALRSPLTFVNDKAYGLTFSGGTNDAGVLYEWDPAVNVFTPKVNFNNANGRLPVGALIHSNGELLGVTFFGGANDAGVLFSWSIATNKFTKHGDFIAGEEPAERPQVLGFTLVDPVTNMDVADMFHLIEFNANDRLNIRAQTNELTQSVAFFVNGERYWGENQKPFALFGDRHGDYNSGRFKPGEYNVLAIPYSEKFQKGVAGQPMHMPFRVIDDNVTRQATSFAEVNVFPNPVPEYATIKINGEPNAPIAVEIADQFGNSIKRVNEALDDLGMLVQTLNVQDLRSGTYYLTIKMNEETHTQRILIKQK